jgi:hypothetical protein
MPREGKLIAQGHSAARDGWPAPVSGSLHQGHTRRRKPGGHMRLWGHMRVWAQLCWRAGSSVCASRTLTAANSAWECADGRVWDGKRHFMCVSASSRMFWAVLINDSLSEQEAGAGDKEEWEALGRVCQGGSGQPAAPGMDGMGLGAAGGGGCCFLS